MNINTEKLWYSKNVFSVLLLPLSWLFRSASYLRRIYLNVVTSTSDSGSPFVIVVGNITVGGAGKTPFVAYLAKRCLESNLKVGIVSRGYGRNNENKLLEVLEDSDVVNVGDEALMLRHQVSCPVVVAADRSNAVEYLVKQHLVDIVISDDGLQHYKLARDIEIAVVDSELEFGNGHCLPAGPLREPVSRLDTVDIVVSNGNNHKYPYQYNVHYNEVISLGNGALSKKHEDFAGQKVHAVAGIGNPKRFFTLLENAGIQVISHAFPDHHKYQETDLEFDDDLPIIMTEKDAVKCKQFHRENCWVLPIYAVPNDKLEQRISTLLKEIK